MKKNFWFKMEWERWLNDERLSLCTLETQGLWVRIICIMHRADIAELKGTIQQLSRIIGCLPEELTRCLSDLKSTGAADVRFGNGDVSILSRSRQRELKAKKNNALYQSRHREKAQCKDNISPLDIDIDKEIDKEEEKKPVANATASVDFIQERIWKDGVGLLTRSGSKESSARACLGGWARDFGEEKLANAIGITLAKNPADPKSWIAGVLNNGTNTSKTNGTGGDAETRKSVTKSVGATNTEWV
jgi:hypothetical protein